MYGRLFAEQIDTELVSLNKRFLTEMLRYRSDFDFFKYHIDANQIDEDLRRLNKKFKHFESKKDSQEGLTQEETQALQMSVQKLIQQKVNLQKPEIRYL